MSSTLISHFLPLHFTMFFSNTHFLLQYKNVITGKCSF